MYTYIANQAHTYARYVHTYTNDLENIRLQQCRDQSMQSPRTPQYDEGMDDQLITTRYYMYIWLTTRY